MNKKALYESIMRSVSIEVKKALNESYNTNTRLTIDIDDDDCYFGNEYYLEDVGYIENVDLDIKFYYEEGEAPTYDYPGSSPVVDILEVTFKKEKYTEYECKVIQKYIEDHKEELEDMVYEQHVEEMDDRLDRFDELNDR